MIYLDNVSTTRQSENSLKVFNEYASSKFFNPSSIYAIENSVDLDNARKVFLERLKADFTHDIIFTGSATEANNIVLNSFKDNIVISAGEHPSVFNLANHLLQSGKNIKICPLQKNGEVDYNKLEELLDENTKLISIIHVNNETGAINDLKRICEIKNRKCKDAYFHSDGVQAFCKIDFSVLDYGLDFYTMSGHKIGGPKGIGALYAKNKKKLKTFVFGGGQEFDIRSGTENLPAIMSFAEAVKSRKNDIEKIKLLRENFLKQLTDEGIKQNGFNGSPYILSLCFTKINGETLVNFLKEKGVYVSRVSACSSKKAGNRVLKEVGLSDDQIKWTIRVSFFETNTLEEVIEAGKIVNSAYQELKGRIF